jgi:hypothetical protein
VTELSEKGGIYPSTVEKHNLCIRGTKGGKYLTGNLQIFELGRMIYILQKG